METRKTPISAYLILIGYIGFPVVLLIAFNDSRLSAITAVFSVVSLVVGAILIRIIILKNSDPSKDEHRLFDALMKPTEVTSDIESARRAIKKLQWNYVRYGAALLVCLTVEGGIIASLCSRYEPVPIGYAIGVTFHWAQLFMTSLAVWIADLNRIIGIFSTLAHSRPRDVP